MIYYLRGIIIIMKNLICEHFITYERIDRRSIQNDQHNYLVYSVIYLTN
jgi:hypothetical protein